MMDYMGKTTGRRQVKLCGYPEIQTQLQLQDASIHRYAN